jgi:hypothetical protein
MKLCTDLIIRNPEECSYYYAEYTNLADIYLQSLLNPNLVYVIKVKTDFSTLFRVTNKISANIEIHRHFNTYQKAQKFAQESNGILEATALCFKVAWKDLTDEQQTDYYYEEFNNYEEALKYYQWAESYEQQGIMKVKPIIHIFQ